MSEFIAHTFDAAPQATKHLLRTAEKQIGYIPIQYAAMPDHERAQQLLIQSGQRTVPQIFINEKPIGGYTKLSQLLSNSEFDLTHTQSLI